VVGHINHKALSPTLNYVIAHLVFTVLPVVAMHPATQPVGNNMEFKGGKAVNHELCRPPVNLATQHWRVNMEFKGGKTAAFSMVVRCLVMGDSNLHSRITYEIHHVAGACGQKRRRLTQ
jgi:hypothetical protein